MSRWMKPHLQLFAIMHFIIMTVRGILPTFLRLALQGQQHNSVPFRVHFIVGQTVDKPKVQIKREFFLYVFFALPQDSPVLVAGDVDRVNVDGVKVGGEVVAHRKVEEVLWV